MFVIEENNELAMVRQRPSGIGDLEVKRMKGIKLRLDWVAGNSGESLVVCTYSSCGVFHDSRNSNYGR